MKCFTSVGIEKTVTGEEEEGENREVRGKVVPEEDDDIEYEELEAEGGGGGNDEVEEEAFKGDDLIFFLFFGEVVGSYGVRIEVEEEGTICDGGGVV